MAKEQRRGSLMRLGALVALSAVVLAVDRSDVPVVREVREGAATVLGPVEGVAERVSRPVRNAWHGITEYDDLVAENAELRGQLEEVGTVEVEETDTARRLADLSGQLELSWVGEIDSEVAQVTSGPRSNFSFTVQIDKGSDHGIEEGMPVVSSGGLVGRVSGVTRRTATVELITGPDLQVGVRLADTGALGTARGQGRGEPLVVDSVLDPDEEVPEEAGLVTSGVARSVYPEGIPVARVVESRPGAGGLALELLAEPLVDVHRLAYVTVLLWEPPQ